MKLYSVYLCFLPNWQSQGTLVGVFNDEIVAKNVADSVLKNYGSDWVIRTYANTLNHRIL